MVARNFSENVINCSRKSAVEGLRGQLQHIHSAGVAQVDGFIGLTHSYKTHDDNHK